MTAEKRWERGNERDIGADRQAGDTAGMALKTVQLVRNKKNSQASRFEIRMRKHSSSTLVSR